MNFCQKMFVRKFILSILTCTAFNCACSAQSPYYPYSSPYLSSAKSTENFVNALNAAFNPSLIPFIKNLQAACYAEKKYLTDINALLFTVCAPFNGNGLSLTFQHFGNMILSEKTFGCGYGKSFGPINAGVFFQYIVVKIQSDESVSLVKAGIASSIKLTDNVVAGLRITDPEFFTKKETTKIRAASSFALSLGWEASSEVCAGIESLKYRGRPLSVIFSLSYRFAENFTCTLNWDTYSNQPFTALTWKLKQLIIEAGCSYHPSLGASPLISILYNKPS
jgi:hypothetical protein